MKEAASGSSERKQNRGAGRGIYNFHFRALGMYRETGIRSIPGP